jgi:phosphoenolpyruvate carboxykinase (GTP)
MAAVLRDSSPSPTSNQRLLSWVREVAELAMPDAVVWCDGSDASGGDSW